MKSLAKVVPVHLPLAASGLMFPAAHALAALPESMASPVVTAVAGVAVMLGLAGGAMCCT